MRKHLAYFFIVSLLASAAHGQDVSFMSFNIKYDNKSDTVNNWLDRRNKVVEMLQFREPDFVGIQEGMHNQVTYMDEELPSYKYIGVARDDGKTKGEYSCIFYNTERFEVKMQGTFWLSGTPEEVSKGWDAALPRVCTFGRFKSLETDEEFWVFNTHFDHIGKEARKRSAELISGMIKQLNTSGLPVVLMGDFNARPDEEPIQIILEEMTDALSISEKPLYGPEGTFNGFRYDVITERIDYCFVRGMKVKSYEHVDDKLDNNKHLSDHLPVLVHARLK